MAPKGQLTRHWPQFTHAAGLTTWWMPSSLMAWMTPVGHTSSHVPQASHLVASTWTKKMFAGSTFLGALLW